MNVAEQFGDKSNKLLLLNASALYALSAPSTPETVRTEIIERVESGEKVDLNEIARLKKETLDAKQQAESIQKTLDMVKVQNDNLRKHDQKVIISRVCITYQKGNRYSPRMTRLSVLKNWCYYQLLLALLPTNVILLIQLTNHY